MFRKSINLEGYELSFSTEDPWTIKITLYGKVDLSSSTPGDRDEIGTARFQRALADSSAFLPLADGSSLQPGELEPADCFAQRAYKEASVWAYSKIEEQKETEALAEALRDVLNRITPEDE